MKGTWPNIGFQILGKLYWIQPGDSPPTLPSTPLIVEQYVESMILQVDLHVHSWQVIKLVLLLSSQTEYNINLFLYSIVCIYGPSKL